MSAAGLGWGAGEMAGRTALRAPLNLPAPLAPSSPEALLPSRVNPSRKRNMSATSDTYKRWPHAVRGRARGGGGRSEEGNSEQEAAPRREEETDTGTVPGGACPPPLPLESPQMVSLYLSPFCVTFALSRVLWWRGRRDSNLRQAETHIGTRSLGSQERLAHGRPTPVTTEDARGRRALPGATVVRPRSQCE